MKKHITTLPNGLRVLVVDTEAFPSLTTLLLVGAGSRYENTGNNGVAHFFEHMAFKGSKKYPTSQIIASTIDGLGGYFNAFTSKDHTGYWIKAPSEDFEQVLNVISDMVLNPLLNSEEIEREKGVIREEINMYEDTPMRKVGEIFEELLYPDDPLGFHIAGSKDGVSSFTRDTFVEYIDRLYHPSNAVLVVAGGLGGRIDDYQKIISEKLAGWSSGSVDKFVPVKEKQSKPQIRLIYKKTEQAHFCLGFRALPFTSDKKYVMSLLAALLGGGMSSRLFMEVREKRGLCYYIGTSGEYYHDVGSFVTQAGVTIELAKVQEAVRVTLSEHKKVASGDIEDEELVRAKELLKGRLLLSLEDSFKVASFFGTKQILENTYIEPEEVIRKIEKVSKDDIVELARRIFTPSALNFAMIGPFDKESDFEDIVKI